MKDEKRMVLIIKVPKNMKGKKIADTERDIGPLEEGQIITVSNLMAKTLIHQRIAIPYYRRHKASS